MNRTVLIVDDEQMARTLLRLMLVRVGFHVVEAENGYDALKKIELEPPHVVLLDVMMPGMDGFTVCEKLRQDPKTVHLPVIMLSAKSDMDSIQRGLRAGASKYLTKPISPDELARHVRDFFEPVSPPNP